jgi:hypothetical protein
MHVHVPFSQDQQPLFRQYLHEVKFSKLSIRRQQL